MTYAQTKRLKELEPEFERLKAELSALQQAATWAFRCLGAYLDGPSCAGSYDPKGALEALRTALPPNPMG